MRARPVVSALTVFAAALVLSAPGLAAQANPVHAHMGHVADGFRGTPDGMGLLPTAIAEVETAQKAVPVLLRQYLNLGGKVIGFNIDASFGHVLDGLIVVDVTRTEAKVLTYFMGAEEANSFLTHHGVDPDRAEADAPEADARSGDERSE